MGRSCDRGELEARGRGGLDVRMAAVPMRIGGGGGGGMEGFLWCISATEGTLGIRRAAGGENSLPGVNFSY